MEKQDPGLRAGCYVAKKYIEEYLSYAREDLSNLLSAHTEHNQKNAALKTIVMQKRHISGFDSPSLAQEFFYQEIGDIKINNYIAYKNLYLEKIALYRENIHKLNLVLYGITIYLDNLNRPYVSIPLDDAIVIETKEDLLELLTYMDLPERVMAEVSAAELLDESILPELHCPKKIMFMLSVQHFLDIILDPLITRWQESLDKTFNKVAIQAILDDNLLFIDNKIEEYHRILADTNDKKQRNNIENRIEDWEKDRLKIEKTYNDQLKLSKDIQEVLEPMKLLRECMWHAAYTGASFSFLSCAYETADDLVDLAEVLLSQYMLKMRLPKSHNRVKQFRQYVGSYNT